MRTNRARSAGECQWNQRQFYAATARSWQRGASRKAQSGKTWVGIQNTSKNFKKWDFSSRFLWRSGI